MSDLDWKRPDEFLKIQRLKQKQRALQARLQRPSSTQPLLPDGNNGQQESHSGTQQKRRNPFAKGSTEDNVVKKHRYDQLATPTPDDGNEDSLFQLLLTKTEESRKTPAETGPAIEPHTVPQKHLLHDPYLQDNSSEDEIVDVCPFLPMDWTLKSKLRVLSALPIAGNNLKTNQEASGLSSFVRGIDMQKTSTSMDISLGAQFHQATLYWQHPNLPWLTLYPRTAVKDQQPGKFPLGEVERQALARAWGDSFRSLFQLVRSRQCPYFYVCANNFTALFRAAGIGGREETHAILTPTTRGFRQALREEEIEFTMPLKPKANNDHHNDSAGSTSVHTTATADNKTDPSVANGPEGDGADSDDDDDMAEEQWLESLGVEANHIQEITKLDQRRQNRKDLDADANDRSTIVIEGVECQAFFNFLFNSKTATTNVGRLAGIPPTLLAPVAFLGATLKSVQTRTSKVRMENVDYHSVELRGVVLPHVLPHVNNLLRSEMRPSFSASMVSHMSTLPLTKVAIKLLDESIKVSREKQQSDFVFGQENLSDCGLNSRIVESMCRCAPEAIRILERMCFNVDNNGYTFT